MHVSVVVTPDSPRGRHWAATPTPPGVTLSCVPWRDVIAGRPLPEGPVRLDSWGHDDATIDALLRRGHGRRPRHEPPPPGVAWTTGVVAPPALLHAGWQDVLEELEPRLANRRMWLRPRVVAAMADKLVTRAALRAAGVPHPPGLEDLPSHADVDARIAVAVDRGFDGLYVKLQGGASASGLVYLKGLNQPPIFGTKTFVPHPVGWQNSRRLSVLPLSELRPALAFLEREGATWEAAIPLARLRGRFADVRVVVYGGEVVAMVGRAHGVPITNLHLGGQRISEAALRDWLPSRTFHDVRALAVRAVRALDAHAGGVDVAIEDHTWRPWVLEVNPMGDFFPSLTEPSLFQRCLERLAAP